MQRFALVDGCRVQPATLDAIVRDVWTDDILDQHHRCVRFIGQPGPPWALFRPHGDDYYWFVVNPGLANGESLSDEELLPLIDLELQYALQHMREHPLTTSEALVAGERRRSP